MFKKIWLQVFAESRNVWSTMAPFGITIRSVRQASDYLKKLAQQNGFSVTYLQNSWEEVNKNARL